MLKVSSQNINSRWYQGPGGRRRGSEQTGAEVYNRLFQPFRQEVNLFFRRLVSQCDPQALISCFIGLSHGFQNMGRRLFPGTASGTAGDRHIQPDQFQKYGLSLQSIKGDVQIVGEARKGCPFNRTPPISSWILSHNRFRSRVMDSRVWVTSSAASRQAIPSPTIPGTLRVPGRSPRSWPPPNRIGSILTPLRKNNAPIPWGLPPYDRRG